VGILACSRVFWEPVAEAIPQVQVEIVLTGSPNKSRTFCEGTVTMYVLPDTVQFNSCIPALVKNFLRALAHHCGSGVTCFPSQDRIARFMDKSIRTVQRAEKWAREMELVQVAIRPSKSNLYQLLCMEHRPSRHERRQAERAKSYPQGVINSPPTMGGDHRGSSSYILTDQRTNNAVIPNTVLSSKNTASYQQTYPQGNNNGSKGLKAKRNHPALVRVIAEDLAEGLHAQKSLLWFMKLAWRVSEDILREAMSWVKQEYQENKCSCPSALFTWRLREHYHLQV